MTHRPAHRLAVAVVSAVLPLGLLAAAPTASTAGTPPVAASSVHAGDSVEVAPRAKPGKTGKSGKSGKSGKGNKAGGSGKGNKAAKAAAKARKVARQAAKDARKAAKAAKAADRAVKKALAKAQRTRTKAQKAGTRAALKKNAKAWKAFQRAKKKRSKAERKAAVAERKAQRKLVTAERKAAQATEVTSVRLDALPGISQPGAGTAPADAAAHVVAVRATPAVPYLPVTVEALSGGRWKQVATTRTGPGGIVELRVPRHESYRAVVKGTTSPADSPAARIDFSDEFDRTDLAARWDHRMTDYNVEGMRACSKGDPRATTLDGRALQLWVKRDPDRDDLCPALRKGSFEGPYSYRLNGHVSTRDSYSFTYGIAAARMKFQAGEHGSHASFWLQPASRRPGGTGPAYTGAEIDVIEYFGLRKWATSSGLAQFTYHDDPTGARVKTGGVLPDVSRFLADKSDSWFDRYHVFSVEWTPTEYVFRIDGLESWRSEVGISHRPQYLILSLLSSDYEIANAGAAGEEVLGSQHADVDWVRVWK